MAAFEVPGIRVERSTVIAHSPLCAELSVEGRALSDNRLTRDRQVTPVTGAVVVVPGEKAQRRIRAEDGVYRLHEVPNHFDVKLDDKRRGVVAWRGRTSGEWVVVGWIDPNGATRAVAGSETK